MNSWLLGSTRISRGTMFILSNRVLRSLLMLICIFLYCEIIHYPLVLLRCTWPAMSSDADYFLNRKDLKVMFIADTHLLGSREGHWFDKLRREWQMKQAFQTSMLIHKPDAVFVLGDLLDEGKWCSDEEFNQHVARFKRMFAVPDTTHMHVVSGNHDEGFHYMMTKQKHERFTREFKAPSVRLVSVSGNLFVLVNSMAMEGDGCSICRKAEKELEEVSKLLGRLQKCQKMPDSKNCSSISAMNYVQPILVQHFPMFRKSDDLCTTKDAAPASRKSVPFRVKYDCLDQRSSQLLFSKVKPRLVLSAHTHDGCRYQHPNKVIEWSVSSFSWRNRNDPTFLMARVNQANVTTAQCFLPQENTILMMYGFGSTFAIISLLWPTSFFQRRKKTF